MASVMRRQKASGRGKPPSTRIPVSERNRDGNGSSRPRPAKPGEATMTPDAPRLGTRQFSISRVMVAIAAIALVLAMPRLVASPDDPVVRCLLALLIGFILLHFLVGEFAGYPCPACSRWTLRRLARHRRYFRCSSCGARVKGFGLGPWLDASGPEDAARYRNSTDAGTWRG